MLYCITNIESTVKAESLEVSERIGLGKGIINDPEDFDALDDNDNRRKTKWEM